ncbi:hypothetical protein EDB83DRAFT_2521263 [Lactarius deliciosus]|nr:hypothetical protein EDB83DRAFT_2521263 [Lactarius deliciosus]
MEGAPNIDEDVETTEDDELGDDQGDDLDQDLDDQADNGCDLYNDSENPPPAGPPSSPSEWDLTSAPSESATAALTTAFMSVQRSDLFRTYTPLTASVRTEEALTPVTMATCGPDVTVAQVTSTTDLTQAEPPSAMTSAPVISPELEWSNIHACDYNLPTWSQLFDP